MISLLADAETREVRLKLALESVLAYADTLLEGPEIVMSSISFAIDVRDLITDQLSQPLRPNLDR